MSVVFSAGFRSASKLRSQYHHSVIFLRARGASFFGFSSDFPGFFGRSRSLGASRLEFFHLAGGVNQFFFAGVEGMALVANFNVNFRLG